MAEKAWEDMGGVHYVKDDGSDGPKSQRSELCNVCMKPATCCARLYVPPYSIALDRSKDVSVLLCGLYWCDRHFSEIQAQAQRFVTGERGAQIREAIELEYRQRGGGNYPNFDKAVIGRIPLSDPDFARGQVAVDVARQMKP